MKGTDDMAAGNEFRDTLILRADAHNPYPLWHGWAIVEAYLAGVKAERKRTAGLLRQRKKLLAACGFALRAGIMSGSVCEKLRAAIETP